MNWKYLRQAAFLDTRARFVATIPHGGVLLDLGSADGETLGHMSELRPDLKFCSVDIAGKPERYPKGCDFQRADLVKDRLRWPDGSMDAITCMQLIEHLRDLESLLSEVTRLLRPGGQVYFETPHPKSLTLSSPPGKAAGTFTMNFFDDRTHILPVAIGALAQNLRTRGLEVVTSGISRSWLFAAAYPVFLFLPASRKKFTARVHWLGWSAYVIARRA